MKTKIKSKKAFSLIELMIVIAIIAVMTGVLFATNKGSSQPKYDVDTAARELVAMIRQQQNNALSGQMIDTGSGKTKVCGVGVKWDSDSAQAYYIQNDSSTGSDTDCTATAGSNPPPASGSTIGPDVVFKRVTISPAPAAYIFYKFPLAGITSSQSIPARIILTSTSNSTVKHTICVFANSIKDKPADVDCNSI